MLLMIDNYDSFTYNLVQYFGELGEAVTVFRNDEIGMDEIGKLNPNYIVISPGPSTPSQAGISLEVIQEFGGLIPVLGVCLGCQAIGQAYGGKIVHSSQVMHGKTSSIRHNNSGVFRDLPDPFVATRYHSLMVDPNTLPKNVEVTAWTDDGIVMGVRHTEKQVEGVQFHPESILSQHGYSLLKNFLETGKR